MILAWICAIAAIGGLCMVCVNLGVFPVLAPGGGGMANVVACVAMRDEEGNAARCIGSLLAQPEISAIVVCDDDSSDATATIAREISRLDSRVHVLRASGSKCAALTVAALKAAQFTPRYLLFTDADVAFDRGALAALVSYAQRSRAAAVTAWPRLSSGNWADYLFTPAIVQLLLHALPMRLSGSRNPKITAGNGQIFLVERHAYAAAGGHAAIDSPVEDVALAQNLARAGYPARFACGARLASARGYGSVGAAVRGLGRSLYYGGGAGACIAFALWQMAAVLFPLALLRIAFVPSVVALAAALLSRWIVAIYTREPVLAALAVPLGSLASAGGAFAALVLGLRGSLSWRGRALNA